MKPLEEQIKGQPKAIAYLQRIIDLGTYPKALLFYGPPGVGKVTTAIAFANNLNRTGDVAKDTRLEDLVSGGEHPDIKVWRPESVDETIRIDVVREFLEEARNPKFEAPVRRVLILGDIHQFPSHRQTDALLKTVEDGLGDTIFIFTATSLEAVFPTLRSRLVPVRFRPLGPDLIREILPGPDTPERDVAIALGAGSLDYVRRFMRPSGPDGWSGLDMRTRAYRVLLNAGRTPVHVLFKFVDAISRDDYLLFLETMESLCLDALLTEESLYNKVRHRDMEEEIKALCSRYRGRALARIVGAIQETKRAVQDVKGLQRKHHISALLLEIVGQYYGDD